MDPPQVSGAVGVAGDVVSTPLQPPLAVVVVSHVANDASIAAWVWQAASVLSVAQVNTTGVAAVTVNVLVHVAGAPQLVV